MLNNPDNLICERVDPVARLRGLPFTILMDKLLYGPVYFVLLAAVTICANVFAAELPMYVLCVLLGLYLSFFGKDYLPLLPVFVCCYISPSAGNNPGRHESSIFFGTSGLLLLVMVALFVVSLIFRLATDPVIGRKAFFTHKRALLPGILALGAAYLLAGAGSGHYFAQKQGNLVFAILQFLSVFLLYYVFSGAVRWDEAPKGYMAWSGMCIGFVLLFEILNIYLTQDVIVNGQINRYMFYTGWGQYNNIGAMLTMMIPFPFQLACDSKRSWLWYLCAVGFLLGVMLTCSRTCTVISIGIYLISCWLVMFKSRNRRIGLAVNGITLVAGVTVFLIFREQLSVLFASMFSNSDSLTIRLEGYRAGIRQFLEHPIFGGTFYPLDADLYEWSSVDAFTAFFPPRWHNTQIQLAASCGIVGLAAYLFHRIQTVWLILRRPSKEVLYGAISILALLLTSMLDCHFFNIGPTLFYSLALAFMEHCNTQEQVQKTAGT